MTYHEFKSLVTSVLLDMDRVRKGLYSVEAVELICMICAHESSGGKYRQQLGGGPARGVLQFEERTYNDVWANSDTIHQVARELEMHQSFCQVEHDDVHSIFVARHKIAMDTHAIPKSTRGMAEYAKRVWNSELGKATPEKYLHDYELWVSNGS